MKISISVLSLLLVFAIVSAMVIDEPCRTDAYPPSPSTRLETFVLNLDASPHDRWSHIVAPKKKELKELIEVIKELVSSKVLLIVNDNLAQLVNWLPHPYSDEIKGIAEATGLPLGEAVLYNIFYEVFSACTSIIGQDETGKLFHGRNLDFGLLMGWDKSNNTWAVTEKLRKLMINVDYQKNGKTIYKAVHFIGYVGILTAVKPQMFTLTVNERFALDGGYVGLVEWLLGLTKGQWMGFLTRTVMENATSYAEAKDKLSDTTLLAPAYFILGGVNAGEGCIITRSRTKNIDTLNLDSSKGKWYLLETNYDHWKKPLFIDDRRTPGHKCMNKLGQKSMGFKGLFNVLSTRSTLNKLTSYTALMQVDDGSLETYLQDCKDPCWPW